MKILLSVLLIAGCASTSSHIVTGTARAPVDPAMVKIYTTPPAKFEEIGIVDASSRHSGSFSAQGKLDAMIKRLKEEAAKLGANGIILSGFGNMSTGSVGTAYSTSSNTAVGASSSVIHKTGQGRAIFVIQE